MVNCLPDECCQRLMIRDMLMIEKMIFQVFVRRFDHGIGTFDIALGNEVMDGRIGSSVDPVGNGTGIF